MFDRTLLSHFANKCVVRQVCGVPQGSALGPVEFIVYTEEFQETIDVDYHLYADDIQLLARMKVVDVDAKLQHVHQCVVSIKDCCSRRRLQLNPDKTELAWMANIPDYSS
jgi:hypothetical protein